MKNKELADLFGRMADILEFKGENPFKISAYRKASRIIGDLTRDIDILATGPDPQKIAHAFTHLPEVKEVLASGETKASVIVGGGIQIDLRVVEEDSYGAALQYFTGSKGHNIHLRGIARAKGIKINEYGVFKGEKKIGGKEEKDVYRALGMDWIEPELREDRGEIEAAREGRLPDLVQESEVRGDLHIHSKWSDGTSSIEEIARAAQKKGYQYVAICDHSKSLRIAHGLDELRLMKQIEEIDFVNEKLKGFQILKGTELDILTDGKLDFPEKILEKLDLVIAAVHSGFKQDKAKMTKRIVRALENPYIHILAHRSGRLLGARDPYEVEIDEVMEAAKQYGKALEINAYFERLDLDDIRCRKAKEMGIRTALGTDAHHLDQMWMMSLGVAVARRGWLETPDLLNTLSLKGILKWCQARR